MAHKDVTITIKVTLTVPSDDEYDQESYFEALKASIEESDYLMEDPCFEEVDQMKVEHVKA